MERQSPASVASYWQLNSIPASGSVNGTGSASGYTTYGPLVVSPSMFPGRLAKGTGTWVAQPDMAGFNDAHLFAISVVFTSTLLSALTLTTNLPTVLADIGDNYAVARSLLGISAFELLVLTVAALLAVARLLAAQREGETALLTARGATRWQLTRLTAAEVIPLSLVTALIGGVAGIWLARLLGSTLYGPGTAGGSVPNGGISVAAPGTWLDALAAALGIAVLSIGALLYPVLRPGRAAAPVQRGRRACLPRDGGRRRLGAGRAGGAGLLAAAPVFGRLDVCGQPAGHRSGARARACARAGGRHGAHAAAAARRGPRRRPGVGGGPRAHLGAGRLAVQPPAAAPGRRRTAAGDGRRHRHAGARSAPELDQVRWSNRDGRCNATNEQIARLSACSVRSARRAVAELVKAGYLSLELREQTDRTLTLLFKFRTAQPPPDKNGHPPRPRPATLSRTRLATPPAAAGQPPGQDWPPPRPAPAGPPRSKLAGSSEQGRERISESSQTPAESLDPSSGVGTGQIPDPDPEIAPRGVCARLAESPEPSRPDPNPGFLSSLAGDNGYPRALRSAAASIDRRPSVQKSPPAPRAVDWDKAASRLRAFQEPAVRSLDRPAAGRRALGTAEIGQVDRPSGVSVGDRRSARAGGIRDGTAQKRKNRRRTLPYQGRSAGDENSRDPRIIDCSCVQSIRNLGQRG